MIAHYSRKGAAILASGGHTDCGSYSVDAVCSTCGGAGKVVYRRDGDGYTLRPAFEDERSEACPHCPVAPELECCSGCGSTVAPLVDHVKLGESYCSACAKVRLRDNVIVIVVMALRAGPSVRKAVAAYSETVVEARTIVRSA